jgi:tripartite-type tricarboxylate transporter receptor subunit TctC
MILSITRSFALFLAASIAGGLPIESAAASDPFPTKAIRIISPFSAGSPPDTFGRLVAQHMSVSLGQSVLVENRPGAGTTIGTKAGAAADADGYTLVQANATLNYAPLLYPNAGYDPVKSFAPVALVASWSHVLMKHPSVEASTLQELIAYAKARPGKLNIGSPLGNPPHVLAHMFAMEAGIELNQVTYRQTPQIAADLIAGRLQLYFTAGQQAISMIRNGQAKAYATTSPARDAALPNVPTMKEAGLPAMMVGPSDWTGFLAPAGTPPAVIARLNAAANEALESVEIRERVRSLGWESTASTPQQFAEFIVADARKWVPVVKAVGLKGE